MTITAVIYSNLKVPAVRPAVRVQYNHCRSRSPYVATFPMFNLYSFITHIFYRLYLMLDFCDSKQRRGGRATLLLSDRSSCITRPETSMSSVAAVKRHPFFMRRKKRLTKKVFTNCFHTTDCKRHSVERG